MFILFYQHIYCFMTDHKYLPYLLLCYKTLTQQQFLSLSVQLLSSRYPPMPMCVPGQNRLKPKTLYWWQETWRLWSIIHRKISSVFHHICVVHKTAIVSLYVLHAGIIFVSIAWIHSMPPLLCGHLMTRLLLKPMCGPITQHMSRTYRDRH